MGPSARLAEPVRGTFSFVATEAIHAGRPQRRGYDEAGLARLADSIRAKGVLQPLVLEPTESGFELLVGSRRLAASKRVGLEKVPAYVLEQVDVKERNLITAIENLQREDLNRVDEVDAVLSVLSELLGKPRDALSPYLHRLRTAHNAMSRGDLVEPVDMAEIERLEAVWAVMSKEAWPSFVANKLDIRKMPEDLLEAVRVGELSYTKAVALRKVKDKDDRTAILDKAKGNAGLPVREVRARARASVSEHQSDEAAELATLVQRLSQTGRWRALSPEARSKAAQLLKALQDLFECAEGDQDQH